MSDLRDARLRRALEDAPDADLRPDPRTRRAVLDAARQAAAPRLAWWQKLWQGLGQRNRGWSAALATVVMATVVTALWYDRQIPVARPQSDISPPRAAAPAPEPAPVTTPAAQAPAAPPAAAPARKEAPAAKREPRPSSPPVPSQRAEEPRERRAEFASDAMRDQSVREELAKSAPAPAAPSAPAAAAAPPPAMSRSAPAGLASQRESAISLDWTHVRITVQERSADFLREQVPALAQLLDRIARETQSQELLQAQVTARIELMREGVPPSVIEVAGSQLRWVRPGGGSSTTRLEPAQRQALNEELSRLQQR